MRVGNGVCNGVCNGGAIMTSRRVRGPAAHRAADRAAACKTLSVCTMPSRAPRRWRGGAMGTSRPTAMPHEGGGTARARGEGATGRGEGFSGKKDIKNRFHRIPAIDSTEPEFPHGKQAVVRNWRQPLHRHRFGRHRCGFRRPCSSGRLYGWYRCRCRHRRCTGRWSGSQPVSSRVVP